MRYDHLLNPVSEAEPCGPDLDEIGDDGYLNYMMGAGNRLPQRYFDPETNVPFDRTKIELKNELKPIGEFLEQSRDLRLLTTEARFQALAGQIEGFSECLQAMAGLLTNFWEKVHPQGFDGDYTLRQNTIGVLNERATIVFPLQYAPILRDQRLGWISLREYALADGKATPREEEPVVDLKTLTNALQSDAHKATLEKMHAAVLAGQDAVATIQERFDEETGSQFSPDFDLLRDVLRDLRRLVELGRPDLAPQQNPDEGFFEAAELASGEEGDGQAGPRTEPAAGAAAAAKIEATPVSSRAAAAAALLAAETYFGRREPSSPALILVHQARMLIGQPLTAALDALVPDNAEYASMVVEQGFGFVFSMAKMRSIVEDYAASAEQYEDGADEVPTFTAETRQEAASLIYGVSAFYRNSEPSSPVPILLARAEKSINQNFLSILSDLLPKPTTE